MIYGPEVLLGVEFEWESICLKAVSEAGVLTCLLVRGIRIRIHISFRTREPSQRHLSNESY